MIVDRLKRIVRGRPPRYRDTTPAHAERFDQVYRTRTWATGDSASGEGSERDSPCVHQSVQVLTEVCSRFDVRSIADVPCGDFNWFDLFLNDHPTIDYIGYDVVEAIVAANRVRHPDRRFETLDITRSPPEPTDLIFCKDLVNHLFERDVWAVLENLAASGSRLLLITSNAECPNAELILTEPGASRLLDLTAAPYSLPEPIWADHYLSLWALDDVARRLAERTGA